MEESDTGGVTIMNFATASKVKKSGIRAVNQGTRYDFSGNLRRITRSIERGEEGDVRDVVVLISCKNNNGSDSVATYHWGNGSEEKAHWMLSTAKNRVEPA